MSKDYKTEIEKILASGVDGLNDERVHGLFVALVESMKVDGLNQFEIYEVFEGPYMKIIHSEVRNEEEDEALSLILARIWGWCVTGQGLFPQHLDNESLAAFRRDRESRPSEQ